MSKTKSRKTILPNSGDLKIQRKIPAGIEGVWLLDDNTVMIRLRSLWTDTDEMCVDLYLKGERFY